MQRPHSSWVSARANPGGAIPRHLLALIGQEFKWDDTKVGVANSIGKKGGKWYVSVIDRWNPSVKKDYPAPRPREMYVPPPGRAPSHLPKPKPMQPPPKPKGPPLLRLGDTFIKETPDPRNPVADARGVVIVSTYDPSRDYVKWRDHPMDHIPMIWKEGTLNDFLGRLAFLGYVRRPRD